MLEDGRDDHRMTLAVERSPAREHFVEHGSERKDVASRVGRLSVQLFRREVLQGTGNHAFTRKCLGLRAGVLEGRRFQSDSRQAKIDQHHTRAGSA